MFLKRKEESKFDEGYLEVFNKDCTLLDLIHRYIKEVLPKKKVCLNETIILKAFMRQEFVNKSISKVSSEDFAKYRDKRLEKVKNTKKVIVLKNDKKIFL